MRQALSLSLANKWSWSNIAAWFRPLRRRNSRISKNSLIDRMLTSIPGSLFHIAHKSVIPFNPSLTSILTCKRPLRLPMMGLPKRECCGGGILAVGSQVWDKDRADPEDQVPEKSYWTSFQPDGQCRYLALLYHYYQYLIQPQFQSLTPSSSQTTFEPVTSLDPTTASAGTDLS